MYSLQKLRTAFINSQSLSISLKTFMHMYVCVRTLHVGGVQLCVCRCTHVNARAIWRGSSSIILCFIPLRQGLSLNPKLIGSARSTG